MSVQQSESTAASPQDLEITAELPVLDVASADAEPREAPVETDTWSAVVSVPRLDDDLHSDLQALTRQLREVEARLHAKSTRVLELERGIEDFHEERRAAAERLLAAEVAQRQVDERGTRSRELEARGPDAESLARALVERDRLIADLRHALAQAEERATSHLEMLQTLEARRGIDVPDSLERASGERETRLANMEAELVGRARHTSELEAELGTRAAHAEALAAEVSSLSASLEAERAAHERAARESTERLAAQTDALAAVRRELHEAAGRSQELEGDLRAAEDTIHRLEAELRGKSQRLEELAKASEEWRAPSGGREERKRRAERLDGDVTRGSSARGAPRVDLEGFEPVATAEPLPDGARRLLVRTVGDSEVVHVLGRKTTVGRTPDNDLQIEARFISRHHAVILAGPVQTVIEDLNSTNGVRVNNRRVTRQALRDGDVVMIGKTRFRFSIRA